MSEELTNKELMRLKEEYAAAVVEHMTQREARAYLTQIIYNDVSVAGADEVTQKIQRTFGDGFLKNLIKDIRTCKS